MSKRVIIVFSLMVLTMIGLSACTPTCDPGSLQPPDLQSPNWREVVDGSAALLEWSYSDTCEPDNFEIILSQDRDFSVIEHTQLVAGSSTSWTPPLLDIAEEYFWRVRAKVGSTYGPYSHELRSFFTLPYCDAGDLVMPSLQLPTFGGIFDRAYDSLEWEWPLSTCIPESYRVEVSMGSPSFTDTTYNGATGSPGTRWGFGSTPPAATQFWWRISAYADGAYGPPSLAYMFWTDPVCPAASLVAPEPIQPIDGETATIANPIFSWSYPDPSCVPEGYHVWVSDAPDMSSIKLEANNPTLSALAFQAGIPFDDCGEYWWQVAAVSESVESIPSSVERFIIDTAGACDCAPGATTIPVQNNPANYEILPDTDAHLSWYNPGGCFPDGAAVSVSTDHDFAVSDDTTSPGSFVVGYDPPGLEPATQYRWKVAYYVDDGGPVIGDYSSPRSFFTGPECTSPVEVMAPVRLAPADGSVVNTLTPALKYNPGDPGCIPDGYLLHLHTLPDMSDPNLLGEYSIPGTTVLPDPPLTDCTTYYWTVTAVQDGGYGPESDMGSFSVDVDGSCLPPGIPATAKKNNFCRVGTFPEHHAAVWTFETGDPALAVARNPFTTYLQLLVLDKETNKPLEPLIICWSLLSAFEPGWKPLPDPSEADFKDLPVVNPPPTPTPTPPPYCDYTMDPNSCLAAGGTPNLEKKFCQCP
jgi:hypothetical protein